MFESEPHVEYQSKVEGTYGVFETPGGTVAFLLSKARLGAVGTDRERRLTDHLRPVREVLVPDSLNFNQLLQRDLDDHRVATSLLPYVLDAASNAPSFFPPILAVLLPFHGRTPASCFPQAEKPKVVSVDDMTMLETRFGEAYSTQHLCYADGTPHAVKLGRLSWNDELAKLVVIDGQHRAMALLAINRTLSGTWEKSGGTRFRHFYEHRVKKLMQDWDADLDAVEFPVTLCWFPERSGPEADPHRAARKLFVDVNKEARQPSEARLILLSDTELPNIFARAMLNRLREQDPPLPLSAIEYDNPERDSARPVRWSVLTNLVLIRTAVLHTVFCNPQYLDDMAARFGGRPNWSKMNDRMRRELGVKSVFPEVIDDGERRIRREHLKADDFLPAMVPVLTERFMEGWGEALLRLFGDLLPYRAHCSALEELEESWLTDDAHSSLAKDAIFVGVGMYWTLRDSYEHWRERRSEAKRRGAPQPEKTDIAKAWECIVSKSEEFDLIRANHYLGSTTTRNVKDCRAAYEVFNTHACQLGLVLTIAAVAEKAGVGREGLVEFAGRMARALNQALTTKVKKTRDRRVAFCRNVPSAINRVRRMDTPIAVYFRYFWLEMLCAPEAAEELSLGQAEAAMELRIPARRAYMKYLVKEQMKALRQSNPSLEAGGVLRDRAQEVEGKELRKALKYWFALDIGELEDLFVDQSGDESQEAGDDESEEDDSASQVDDAGTEADGIEGLLKKFSDE